MANNYLFTIKMGDNSPVTANYDIDAIVGILLIYAHHSLSPRNALVMYNVTSIPQFPSPTGLFDTWNIALQSIDPKRILTTQR